MSTRLREPASVEIRPRATGRVEPIRPGPSRRLALFLLAGDGIALVLALVCAVVAPDVLVGSTGLPPIAERPWALLLGLVAVPFLVAYKLYDNDRSRVTVSGLGEFFSIFNALSLSGFVLVLLLEGTGGTETVLSTREVLLFWVLALVLIPTTRALARRRVIPGLVAPQRTLIVGAGMVGQSVARKLVGRPDFNIEVVGFVDNEPQPMGPGLGGLRVLGGERDVVDVVRETRAERVVICFSRMSHEQILDILRESGMDRLYISIVPRFFEIMSSNVELDEVDGIPVLDLHPAGLSRTAMAAKRMLDIALTCAVLPLLLPVYLAIALAVKIDSRGPIFFQQPRMGRGGNVFKIYKFRTMVVDAESRREELLHLNEVTGPLFKIRRDPRITRVGRFLRRTSLDELPQLFNVLRGNMSLVGPRPFVTYEAEEIRGWARRRLDLTPGITGAWQVMGRNDMPFEEMIKLDYLYVTNWSLALDLKLLLQTLPVVFRRRGAY